MGTHSDSAVAYDFLLSTHSQSCKQLTDVLQFIPKDALFDVLQSSTEVISAANAELRRRDKSPLNGFSTTNGITLVPTLPKDLTSKLVLQQPTQSSVLYPTQVPKLTTASKPLNVIPADSNFNCISAPKRNHDTEEQVPPQKRLRQNSVKATLPLTNSTDAVDGHNSFGDGYMLLQFVLVDSPDNKSVPSSAQINCLNERGMGLARHPDGSQFNIPMRMEKILTPSQIIDRLQKCYTTININDLNVKMAIANNGKLEEVTFNTLGDLSDQLVDGDKVYLLPCTVIVAPEETSEKVKVSRPASPDKLKPLSLPIVEYESQMSSPQASIPSVSSITSSIMSAISSPALSCLSASNLTNIPTAASMVTLNANSASLLLTPALSMASVMPTTPMSLPPAPAMCPAEDKASRKTPPSGRETPSSGQPRKSSTRSSRSSLDPLTLDKKLTVEEKRLLEEDRAKAKAGIHVYRAIPPSEKKTRPTKRCALCLQDACRRESRYFCLTCEKGFHVRCFIEDHLRLLKEKKEVLVEVRDDNFNLKESGPIEEVAKIVNARVPVERAANNSRPLRRTQNGVSVAQLTAASTPLARGNDAVSASPNLTPPAGVPDCLTDSSEEENNTPPGSNTIELVVRSAPLKDELRCASADAIKTMLLTPKQELQAAAALLTSAKQEVQTAATPLLTPRQEVAAAATALLTPKQEVSAAAATALLSQRQEVQAAAAAAAASAAHLTVVQAK